MSVTARSFFTPLQLPAGNTVLYTATGLRAIIDKFTGTNTTAGAVTITVFLVPAAGAAGAANTIVPATFSIAAGQCYTFPEIVGHVLNSGDSIVAAPGTATALTMRGSGREVTG